MIYESLTCLTDELNEYFKNKLKIPEEKVLLSALVNQDGTTAIRGENKIVVTLINIEKEPLAKTRTGTAITAASSSGVSSLNINLLLLFSVYFSSQNYAEGLKFLGLILSYLQQKPVFNRANTPSLSAGIEKLTLELETVGMEKLNNLWATMGAKYMPSAIYRMRMLSFNADTLTEYRPAIQGIAGDSQLANSY